METFGLRQRQLVGFCDNVNRLAVSLSMDSVLASGVAISYVSSTCSAELLLDCEEYQL
jgi:hypothetical protein